jgi:tetratricopeptide (TPR) repeat protein
MKVSFNDLLTYNIRRNTVNIKSKTMTRFLAFILALLVFTFSNAQVLDEEIGFKIVKAEYLINTERFEDAIKELNDIIKQNANFKNAMLLRAETKYKLAAYKGAKQDALEFINQNGITAKSAAILGKADFSLGMNDACFNSISAAIALGERDVKLFEIRAEIYENRNQKISACEDWQMAAKLGSTKGAINAKKNCGMKSEVPQEPKQEPKHTDDSPVDESNQNNNNGQGTKPAAVPVDSTKVQEGEVLSNGTTNSGQTNTIPPTQNSQDSSKTNAGASDLLIPDEDNTINEITIDEDLVLDIYGQGLGKRAIMERPSILILAEKDGTVTVEICVNKEGRIDYAEFVASKSTLNQNSLVSLAIRKAKEFWFEESEYPKQCGFIKFKIKGS